MTKIVYFEPEWGESIHEAIRYAIAYAKRKQVIVKFKHNCTEVTAFAWSCEKELYKQWEGSRVAIGTPVVS